MCCVCFGVFCRFQSCCLISSSRPIYIHPYTHTHTHTHTFAVAGCVALLIRLPFSLALPHFVSETIGGLLNKDLPTVKFSITGFVVCGCVDALLDFWCVFLFGYTQHRIIRALRVDLFRNMREYVCAYVCVCGYMREYVCV